MEWLNILADGGNLMHKDLGVQPSMGMVCAWSQQVKIGCVGMKFVKEFGM